MTIEFNNDKTLATVTVDGAVYPLVLREKEALVRDSDLATWLGFARPRTIRQLIERHTALGHISPIEQRCTVQRSSRSGRAMGSVEQLVYLLSQSDALFIATQAKTAMSVKVTKAIIQVFLAYQRGQLAAVAPPPPQLPPSRASLPSPAPKELEQLPDGQTLLRVVVDPTTFWHLSTAATASKQRAAQVAARALRAWAHQRAVEHG